MSDMYLARRAAMLGEGPPPDHFAIHKSQVRSWVGGLACSKRGCLQWEG